jgi:hypothetical protein
MLKCLFQTTDIKSRQVQQKALDFVFGRRVASYDVLAPLMLICAECNNRRLLLEYWNNGLTKHKKEWPGADLRKQLDVCFHAVKSPNLAWIQLFVLIKTDEQLRRGSASALRAVGRPRQATKYSCFVRDVPENTTEADIDNLFEMIGLNCSKITVKQHNVVKVYFNTSDELEQALTMDQFVPRSGARPISVELGQQPAQVMSNSAGADPFKCGIGVKLEVKRDSWEHDKFNYEAGVYITEVFGRGAAAAGLPLRSKLICVDGRPIGMDMELAKQVLVGAEGTEVEVVVQFVITYRNGDKKLKRDQPFQVKRLR